MFNYTKLFNYQHFCSIEDDSDAITKALFFITFAHEFIHDKRLKS